MISSAIVPINKTVHGFGGKKYQAGETVTSNQVSAEVIKKLNGGVVKSSIKKRSYKKSNRRKKNVDR